jgi:hypothetical protein
MEQGTGNREQGTGHVVALLAGVVDLSYDITRRRL